MGGGGEGACRRFPFKGKLKDKGLRVQGDEGLLPIGITAASAPSLEHSAPGVLYTPDKHLTITRPKHRPSYETCPCPAWAVSTAAAGA